MIIGITGGSGCGKTTALKTIEALGGVVIDCDQVYHTLLATDKDMLSAIENRFPGTVQEGRLDRQALAAIVFSDKQALHDLNVITHGAVKREIAHILDTNPPLAAIDAIALFESGLHKLCDVTVAVTAPENVRVDRLVQRDGITPEQAALRINGQQKQSFFQERCDYILENSGIQTDFQKKCLAFFQNLFIIKEKP